MIKEYKDNPQNEPNTIIRDAGIIVLSIIIAVVLAKTGALAGILTSTQEWRVLGTVLAGMFFVSIFTAAPAGVILFEIAAANSIWEVALLGGIGGLLGDLIIFRFVKDNLTQDIRWLVKKTKLKRITHIFRLKLFTWTIPFIGALIVAFPLLSDEVGLAMMGLSKMKTAVFIPISFALNFLGILVIGLFAQGLP